jgi:hypothetical protein
MPEKIVTRNQIELFVQVTGLPATITGEKNEPRWIGGVPAIHVATVGY